MGVSTDWRFDTGTHVSEAHDRTMPVCEACGGANGVMEGFLPVVSNGGSETLSRQISNQSEPICMTLSCVVIGPQRSRW